MLEELIPYYPDLSHNDAQLILYGMAEFNVLEAKKGIEKRVKPGEYYKHQQVLSRKAMISNRILSLAETGTGKTCGFVSFDELLKDNTDLFKKYYYVTLDNLIDSSKRQIICKCTDNKYINDKGGLKAKKAEILKSNKDSFKENYVLMNYYELYTEIVGRSAAELREKFGHCVFNLDELPDIINVDFTTVTKIENDKDGIIIWNEAISQELIMLNSITDLDDPRIRYANKNKEFNNYEYAEKKRIELGMDQVFYYNGFAQYIQIWRMLHAVQDISKVIAGTGTIIKNRPSEALIIANLLLPLDKQFNLSDFSANVFTYNLKKFTPYLNGLISYVKSSNVVAKAKYMGKKLPIKYKVLYPEDDTSDNPRILVREFNSDYTVYKVELFMHQARKFYFNSEDIMSKKIESKDNQYICYVDTNGSYGTEASNHVGGLNFLSNNILSRMECSAVFSEIYRIELSAYHKAISEGKEGPGVCFNYLPLTDTVLHVLKQIFSTGGLFDVLSEDKDFEFLTQISSGTGYCDMVSSKISYLRPKPRAVFLTGKTSRETIDLILDFAGSPDNVDGKYIQFINGSKVMNVGVNVKNSKRFTRAYSGWNEADDKQAKDRVFREDGFDELRKKYVKDIYEKEGRVVDLYDEEVNQSIAVEVYNMCAFSRFYFIKRSNIEIINSTPVFPSVNLYETKNIDGNINVVSEIINGETNYLLNLGKIYHLIGFTDNIKISRYHGIQVLEFCKYGDELILDVEISKDLNNLLKGSKYIVLCRAGIIFVHEYNDVFKSALNNGLILYHDNFMRNYMNGTYIDEFQLIQLIQKENSLDEYKLYPITMKYLSSSEEQYIELEKKSFPARRMLRIFKRFAIDNKVNKQRTYHDDGVDYSLDCDYDVCNYTSISEVLPEESKDSFIYKDGNKFWTNYEILYSANIIDECKQKIIEMISIKHRVKISSIFRELLPKYLREYFINMAIYYLISERYKIYDSFGMICYICSSNDELFLNREFPKIISNIVNRFNENTKSLIAITNNPDYREFFNNDMIIIEEIEDLHVDVMNEKSKEYLLYNIIEKMKNMTYISYRLLLERSLTRIAYETYRSLGVKTDLYQKKQVDDLICGIIFAVRRFKYVRPDGEIFFFHNQQTKKINHKYSEATNLLKFSGEIRVLTINGNNPKWITTNDEFLRNYASAEIERRVDKIKTINLNVIRISDGYEGFITIKSDYYLSLYNGIFRIMGPSFSRDIKSISDTIIKSHLLNIFNSLLCQDLSKTYYNNDRMNENYRIISTLLVSFNKELLKKFFIDNGLFFNFSINEIDV